MASGGDDLDKQKLRSTVVNRCSEIPLGRTVRLNIMIANCHIPLRFILIGMKVDRDRKCCTELFCKDLNTISGIRNNSMNKTCLTKVYDR